MNPNALPSLAQMTGQNTEHLCVYPCPYSGKDFQVHRELLRPLQALISKAQSAGIHIQMISAFRSFERQATIWNRKWRGETPCLDAGGQTLNLQDQTALQKLHLILHWSAFPGLSRHHWGTDFDIFDADAIASGYEVQLLPREFRTTGPCAKLQHWLDKHASEFGLFRPYSPFAGGVAEEPWHLSHHELSKPILDCLLAQKYDILALIQKAPTDIEGIALLTEYFDDVIQKYLCRINPL